MKKILMIIAPADFRDEEFSLPKQVFESNGFQVDVASAFRGNIRGILGMYANATMTLNDALNDIENYAAIVFVGGGGAKNYFENRIALEIAKRSFDSGKITAAICIAPVILANAGILKGKKATVFNGDLIDHLKNKGAEYIENNVVVDGKIVTADGPKAAILFGGAIVKLLK